MGAVFVFLPFCMHFSFVVDVFSFLVVVCMIIYVYVSICVCVYIYLCRRSDLEALMLAHTACKRPLS